MRSSGPPGHGPPATGGVRLRVLGPFAVETSPDESGAEPGAPPPVASRKARTLLKLLAVERGHLVPTARAVDVLWPQGPPARPVENVATLVCRLRSWLGTAVVEGGRENYRLAPDVEVDYNVAESLTVRAEQALNNGHSGMALVPAEQACALLARGRVLEDEPYADWAEPARHAQVALLRRARLAHVHAALATGQPRQAVATATSGVADDPLDEELTRQLMTAQSGAGEPARALAAYARLRVVLAAELGTNPSPDTDALNVALLRDEPLPASPPPAGPAGVRHESGLVERARELAELRDAWGDAATGRMSVQLVVGEAGIGKTSLAEALADEVTASAGRVLRARCYEAERSLFLQPFVDALTPAVAALPPHRLRAMAGGHADVLAGLVPEVALALGPAVGTQSGGGEVRRRAFEAILHLLRRIATDTPLLLLLDDLHNAGTTTIEAVHYLGRRAPGARLLVVGTVRREEGASALATLAVVSSMVEPTALSEAAVAQLANAAGLGERSAAIARRTRGHPLFVVEVLRGLAAGQESVPETLQGAVLARVARTGEAVERVLRAASVFAAEVDPATVATLLGIPEQDAARRCEQALSARLLTVSGSPSRTQPDAASRRSRRAC